MNGNTHKLAMLRCYLERIEEQNHSAQAYDTNAVDFEIVTEEVNSYLSKIEIDSYAHVFLSDGDIFINFESESLTITEFIKRITPIVKNDSRTRQRPIL